MPFAAAGCVVTVVEPNPNALAALSRRAADAGVADRITAVQADSDALGSEVPAGGADLVLAHGLFEVVEDPKRTMAAIVETTAVGGAVSVLVANRTAAVLHRAIAGRLDEAGALVGEPSGRLADELLERRLDTKSLTRLLGDAGLVVELLQGYGVLTDLVPSAALAKDPTAADTLAELELRVATVPALRDVATRLHALARRTVGAV